jgi:hypothetical protein
MLERRVTEILGTYDWQNIVNTKQARRHGKPDWNGHLSAEAGREEESCSPDMLTNTMPVGGGNRKSGTGKRPADMSIQTGASKGDSSVGL